MSRQPTIEFCALQIRGTSHLPLLPYRSPLPKPHGIFSPEKTLRDEGGDPLGALSPPPPIIRRVCGKIGFPKALITLPPRQFTGPPSKVFFHNREYACFFLFSGSWELFYCPLFWGGEMNWMRIGGVCREYAWTAPVPPHPRAMRRTNELKTNRKPNLFWLWFRS